MRRGKRKRKGGKRRRYISNSYPRNTLKVESIWVTL